MLVPGGHHVFTVPRLPDVATTFPRATVVEHRGVVQHTHAICHPGGDVGYPVFTEFGADCLELFRRAGFDAAMVFGPPTADDLAQVYVCRKMGEPE